MEIDKVILFFNIEFIGGGESPTFITSNSEEESKILLSPAPLYLINKIIIELKI